MSSVNYIIDHMIENVTVIGHLSSAMFDARFDVFQGRWKELLIGGTDCEREARATKVLLNTVLRESFAAEKFREFRGFGPIHESFNP